MRKSNADILVVITVFADAIEAIQGSISSGAGCRNIDYSTASSKEVASAIALEYDGLRREDALAAVDLTYGGIGGVKVRGSSHSPIMFKLQIMVFMVLHKVSFGVVPMPAMMRIMMGDSARYSTLKWENKIEKWVMRIIIGILVYTTIQFMF